MFINNTKNFSILKKNTLLNPLVDNLFSKFSSEFDNNVKMKFISKQFLSNNTIDKKMFNCKKNNSKFSSFSIFQNSKKLTLKKPYFLETEILVFMKF